MKDAFCGRLYRPFGFGGLKFPVVPGNGKSENLAVVVSDYFEASHFQDHFATFHIVAWLSRLNLVLLAPGYCYPW